MINSNDHKPETKPAAAAPRPVSDSRIGGDDQPHPPPVDIELTDTLSIPQDKAAEKSAEVPDHVKNAPVTDFESTMIIAPDASLSSKPSSNGNSTEAFIERVKEQLSGSPAEKEEEPFTSTIPQ
jgi:hypothetical protein